MTTLSILRPPIARFLGIRNLYSSTFTRIHALMLMQLWIMALGHADLPYRPSSNAALEVLESFSLWPAVDQCTRWSVRRCLRIRARDTSDQKLRCPTLSRPLLSDPREIVFCYLHGILRSPSLVTTTCLFTITDSAATLTSSPSPVLLFLLPVQTASSSATTFQNGDIPFVSWPTVDLSYPRVLPYHVQAVRHPQNQQ